MLTITQKKTAQSIINIFETGSVLGGYGAVTLIEGDTGHLTYGRSQTTLGSGNLYKLLKQYCDNPGARFRAGIAPLLPRFKEIDFSLDHEHHLHNILRAAADDAVMRETQDFFFDKVYWQLAERRAQQFGIVTALGITVVYDSTVHGAWLPLRDKTNEKFGSLAGLGEKQWISAYLRIRREWLSTHKRPDLRNTIYRMDALQRLVDQNLWGLELPLVVRDEEISLSALNAMPKGSYNGPQAGSRTLVLQTPLLRGSDARLVQLGLSKNGIRLIADGIFGPGSVKAVKEYQTAHGLPATGIVDIPLIAELAMIG
jgi:chitosanase